MDLGTAVAGAWSSGISMYAVAAILGIGGRLDWVDSPDFLQRPWVIIAVLVLFAISSSSSTRCRTSTAPGRGAHLIRPVAGAFLLDASDSSRHRSACRVRCCARVRLDGAKAAHVGCERLARAVRTCSSASPRRFGSGLMALAARRAGSSFVVALVLTALSGGLHDIVVVRSGRRLLARRRRPNGTDGDQGGLLQ